MAFEKIIPALFCDADLIRSADIALIPVIKLLNPSFILSMVLFRLLVEEALLVDSETVDGAKDEADLPNEAEADILFLNRLAVSLLFRNLAGLFTSSD